MKKFYQFSLAMLLLGICRVGALAQPQCEEAVVFALHAWNPVSILLPESLLTNEASGDLVLSQSEFSCADVGQDITVTLTDAVGTCSTIVSVIDNTPPVAIGDLAVSIEIPAGFEAFVINPSVLDDGSYDNCGEVTFEASPNYIGCDMIGEIIDVTLSVTDESGNVNSVITEVSVQGPEVEESECLVDYDLKIIETHVLNKNMIHTNNTACYESTLSLTDMSGAIVENNIIGLSHVGQVLTATITTLANNSTCSTLISVEQFDCVPFVMCDTECRSAPISDCATGHSDTDNIEWPCDISTEMTYLGAETVRPENLVANYGVDIMDTKPTFIDADCYAVATSYYDEVFVIGGQFKIVREWAAVEWFTGVIGEYTQVLEFGLPATGLVWNVDDLLWPEDASARDHRISPEELLNVAKVDYENTRPMFAQNEEEYLASYEDAVLQTTSNYSLVARTWTVTSTSFTNLKAEHIQHITVPNVANSGEKVYVTTHGGRPMPGVTVNNDYTTNIEGIAEVPGTEDLTLEYMDDPSQGLDLVDAVLMKRYILGAWPFDPEVVKIMDIDEDGDVSTLDLVLLNKFYLGIWEDERFGWRFIETPSALANTKGNFTAYKKGDIDDSALLADDPEVILQDDIKFTDALLNKGETYQVGISIDQQYDIYAAQFSFEVDTNVMQVTDVKAIFDTESDLPWRVDSDGSLKVLAIPADDQETILLEEGLFTIYFTAKENGKLAEVLSVSQEEPTYLVDTNLEKIYLGGEVENQITSGQDNHILVQNVKISPNPTMDVLELQLPSNDYKMEIFNTQGLRILTSNKSIVNVSELPKGIYVITGHNEKSRFSTRFVKL